MGSHSYGVELPAAAHLTAGGRGRHAAGSRRRAASVPSLGVATTAKSPVTSWQRATIATALCAGTLIILLFQYQFRHLEAEAAATIYNLVTPTLAASKSPIVWFGLGTSGAFGLLITPDCSVALLLVPLFLLGTALVLPTRLGVRRVLSALGSAAALLMAGNLLRIGAIAVAVRIAGPGVGYEVGHLVIGSAISVIFIGGSLILMTLIITSRPTQRHFPRRRV